MKLRDFLVELTALADALPHKMNTDVVITMYQDDLVGFDPDFVLRPIQLPSVDGFKKGPVILAIGRNDELNPKPVIEKPSLIIK